jgi:hypothetical protein
MNINLPILGKFYNVYQSLTNMAFCTKICTKLKALVGY